MRQASDVSSPSLGPPAHPSEANFAKARPPEDRKLKKREGSSPLMSSAPASNSWHFEIGVAPTTCIKVENQRKKFKFGHLQYRKTKKFDLEFVKAQ